MYHSPLQVDDITITDSYPKAKAFGNHFKSVFTSEDTSSMLHMEGASFPDMPSISNLNRESLSPTV